jgi:L-iditol 2-dehydrogenase
VGEDNFMKALLLSEYKHLAVTDVPEPQIGPDELLIRVRACGICGSDVHGYDGSSGRRIPPIVMGHEAAGVIAAAGEAVTDMQEGDRVTFDSTVSCGHCHFCRRGQVNLCNNRQVLGVSCGEYRRMGAFAEYVSVPRRICYRLPDELPFEKAAMIEAVSVAIHAVSLTPVTLNDTAIVVGAGMIGLLTLQAARLAGCGRVIITDVDQSRLETARQLGASEVILARNTNVAEEVKALTAGLGADIAFECVGATPTIQNSIASTRKGGTVTLIGNITPQVEIPLQSVVSRQIRLQGSCASSGEYPACIDFLARGAIRVDAMLSAIAPMAEGPRWFERLYQGEPNLMKVVLTP